MCSEVFQVTLFHYVRPFCRFSSNHAITVEARRITSVAQSEILTTDGSDDFEVSKWDVVVL